MQRGRRRQQVMPLLQCPIPIDISLPVDESLLLLWSPANKRAESVGMVDAADSPF
jgi:hypothetical protein